MVAVGEVPDMDLALLETTLEERGEPAFRARQVWEWASRGVASYELMTTLPKALRTALAEEVPFSTLDLVADPARPTTTKSRVIAAGQQVVRFDHEETAPLAADVRDALLARAKALLPIVRACVLSDYGKGVVTAEVAGDLIAAAAAAGVPVVVDPKGLDYRKYRGATVVKTACSTRASEPPSWSRSSHA